VNASVSGLGNDALILNTMLHSSKLRLARAVRTRGCPLFTALSSKIGEEGPSIPQWDTAKMRAIADRFLSMRMYAEASNAYEESFYGADVDVDYDGSSWISAALAEYRMGDIAAMAEYLAKAIVFGSETDKVRAQQLLKNAVLLGKQEQVQSLPDARTLEGVCTLYAQLNMHPRALAILKDYAQLLGQRGLAGIFHAPGPICSQEPVWGCSLIF